MCTLIMNPIPQIVEEPPNLISHYSWRGKWDRWEEEV